MKRTVLAFLVAPLWVPVSVLAVLTRPDLAIFIAAILSYAGMVILGLPAFFVLRACNLTTLWIAILTGLAVGGLFGFGFMFWALGGFYHGMPDGPARSVVLSTALHGGILGSIVGATFWLIARPDRWAGVDGQIQTNAQPTTIIR